MLVLTATALGGHSATLSAAQSPATGNPPNVLLIYLEDTNIDLGTYGHPVVQTPGMDQLAAQGMKFNLAYCPSAVCNPSRVSTMTGLYPSTTGIEGNQHTFHADQSNGVFTLPKQFRNHGYHVIGAGKIFHSAYVEPGSWDQYSANHGHDQWISYPQNPDPAGGSGVVYWGPYLNGPDGSFGQMREEKYTDFLIDAFSTVTEPFFAAIGYQASHNPMIYPELFDSLYDPLVGVPPAPAGEATNWQANLDPAAYTSASYLDPAWDSDPEMGRRLSTAAYWRTITYVDRQVQRLLNALAASPLASNTIIVLLSDHGWSTGEHARYGKTTLFERSARIPFLISVPGLATHGMSCDRPVSTLDLYPTLMELTGITPPAGLEGNSLVPLLQDPTASFGPVFSQTFRSNLDTIPAVRTDQFKFVHWPSDLHQLYDLNADPGEYVNLYGDPAYESEAQAHLALLVQAGFVDCAASWSHYGAGLAGTLGVPVLMPQVNPILGQPFQFDLSNSLGLATSGMLFVGFQQAALPAFGGTVHMIPQSTIPVHVPAAGLPIQFTIPFNPANCGLSVLFQGIEADPGAPESISMSQGLDLILGF
jgi:uncharacterized sulfatase